MKVLNVCREIMKTNEFCSPTKRDIYWILVIIQKNIVKEMGMWFFNIATFAFCGYMVYSVF